MGRILWCIFFFVPLAIMLVLDSFCSGRELCRAGLSFTLLLYGIGIAAFLAGVAIARLAFRLMHASVRTRILTMKALFLLPLVPGVIVLGLFAAGLLGRLG